MTYRSIFVHADDTEPCARRLDYAARLAKRYPSELHSSYLPSPSELTRYAKAVMAQDVFDKYAQLRAEQRSAAETAFRTAAQQRRRREDRLGRAAARRRSAQPCCRARHSDLAIIGQPPRDDPREPFTTELANAVVMRCGRPVLFVPSVGEFPTIGRARADRVEGFARIGAGRRRRAAAAQGREEGLRTSPSRRKPRRDGERAVHRRAAVGVPAPARHRGDGAANRGGGHRGWRAPALAGGGHRRRSDRDGRLQPSAADRARLGRCHAGDAHR